MIADGAAIGVMRSDAQVGLVVEQAIDDIGGFAGRRDRNRMVGRLASREVRIEKCGCGAFVMGVDRSDSFPRPGSREVLSIRTRHVGGTERGGERLALLGGSGRKEALTTPLRSRRSTWRRRPSALLSCRSPRHHVREMARKVIGRPLPPDKPIR